jgi:hypothetical protein
MGGLSYNHRLASFNIPTLELWRLNADLLLTYKIIFGLINIDNRDFFSLRNDVSELKPNRGLHFKLLVNKCRTDKLKFFLCNRTVDVLIALPAANSDFNSSNSFRNFLFRNNYYLPQFLTVC